MLKYRFQCAGEALEVPEAEQKAFDIMHEIIPTRIWVKLRGVEFFVDQVTLVPQPNGLAVTVAVDLLTKAQLEEIYKDMGGAA